MTHAGAPRYKVVRTNVKHPDWEQAETVIPEAGDSIQSIAKSKHYLFVVYSNGVVGRIVKYDLATGKTSEIKLPASGSRGHQLSGLEDRSLPCVHYVVDLAADDLRFQCGEGHLCEEHLQHRCVLSGI